ncbi:CDP-alcohol phosphatidyltransferase family protein [uncultured Thiodictyon sp.]|uniref:CDP-alcohol phosphatidyltransferase family protein n=1 Tax=uncultured Thiodictyon sp. TaxID=1846217 RepID=UPI0025D873A0|nr:CDP-alcohol phosphatidyltransferase family protein [uncultured Thiodictyon sp.]
MTQIPLLLTLLRAGLALGVVLLALFAPVPVAFAACLAVAAVSDYFDGAIARHLNIVTPRLRRLDSLVDLLFHLAALFALWWLYPQVIARHAGLIAVLAGLGVARYAFAYAKFRREASYHLWSSKVWGFALFLAFYSLLVLQSDGIGIMLVLALGILAGLEDLAVSVVLREWRTDVPTLFHAWRLSRTADALASARLGCSAPAVSACAAGQALHSPAMAVTAVSPPSGCNSGLP